MIERKMPRQRPILVQEALAAEWEKLPEPFQKPAITGDRVLVTRDLQAMPHVGRDRRHDGDAEVLLHRGDDLQRPRQVMSL